MRTDRVVTRPSSEPVAMRPIVDKQKPVKTLPSLVVGKDVWPVLKCTCIQRYRVFTAQSYDDSISKYVLTVSSLPFTVLNLALH